MLFLTPNQQCQSNEGVITTDIPKYMTDALAQAYLPPIAHTSVAKLSQDAKIT